MANTVVECASCVHPACSQIRKDNKREKWKARKETQASLSGALWIKGHYKGCHKISLDKGHLGTVGAAEHCCLSPLPPRKI